MPFDGPELQQVEKASKQEVPKKRQKVEGKGKPDAIPSKQRDPYSLFVLGTRAQVSGALCVAFRHAQPDKNNNFHAYFFTGHVLWGFGKGLVPHLI